MKQSWVVGVVMLYVVLQGCTMMAQGSTTGTSSVWEYLNNVFQYNLTTDIGSSISMVWMAAGYAYAFLSSLCQIILMYYPVIFHGNYVWFWWCVCLPISAGFVYAVFSTIRGVHAS